MTIYKKKFFKKKIANLKEKGHKIIGIVPDNFFLSVQYKRITGEKLNLNSPVTFNEKLQWLKLYNRNPLSTTLVDKFEVRSFVKEKTEEDILIPSYGVYNEYSEINFDVLPNQFVIKATHTSGNYFLCKNKDGINHSQLKFEIDSWLQREYYWLQREWPYKNVKPRIVIEKYLTTSTGGNINDYRFFCFNGEPKFISVDLDFVNKTQLRRNLYDLDWNLMDEEITYPKEMGKIIPKPENLDQMIKIAKKLSEDMPHVRVDLYNVEGEIYFGELTFYHQSGYGDIRPKEFNKVMGDWIILPNNAIYEYDNT